MANITFIFKKRAMMYYSLNVVINNQKPIMIANGTSINIELSEGIHTIRASIPHQGNEVGVTTVQVDVKPNMNYEITYSMSSMSPAGVFTIKEIPVGSYRIDANGRRVEDKKAVTITKTKKPVNGMMIFIMIFIVFLILSACIPLFFMTGAFQFLLGNGTSARETLRSETVSSKITSSLTSSVTTTTPSEATTTPSETPPKETVIKELQKPYTGYGLKITATDIKTVAPKYPTNDDLIVGIKFVIENISDKNISFVKSITTYADDVLVKESFHTTDPALEKISSGDLVSGKRMEGYYCANVPKGAKHIEFRLRVDYRSDTYVTFSLDIPPL